MKNNPNKLLPLNDQREELFQLAEQIKNKRPKIHKRLLMVYFVIFMGFTRKETAKRIGTTAKTVGKWVERYHENGKSGLLDKPRSGRPREITDEARQLVVRLVQSEASKITDHLTTWSLQTLQRYLMQMHQIDISTTSIHRILFENHITYRKVEETLFSPDPEYEMKKKRIDDARLEAEIDDQVVFLCLDEKGPIHALYHRGKEWMNDKIRRQVPRNKNKSNGKVVLNAAFEPLTNRFWWHFSERRTGEAFLTLLITLSMDPILQKMKKVFLVMDNLPAHFTQNIKDHLILHPQFKVLRLPTYSPELNPIERVFGDMDRQTIQNHYYRDTEELEKRIGSWLEDRMSQPVKEIKAVSPKKTRKQRIKKILKMM